MIQELQFVRMNTDVAGHDIKPEDGEYRMMENLAPPQRGKGMGFVRESLKGTEEITNTDSDYINTQFDKVIGTFEDAPNNKMYYFLVAAVGFNRIMVYDSEANEVSRVIRSQFLPWTPDTKITGISLLDDVLYWCDPVPCYLRIQSDEDFAEIDYNVKGASTAATLEYNFTVAGSDPNFITFQHTITGPISDTDATVQVADAMNSDPAFAAKFQATVSTDGTVIKIVATANAGRIQLTNTVGQFYNCYQTNFDPFPETYEDFWMYPVPPKQRPSVVGLYDTSILINKILNRNWQFSIRQIYDNNQITVLSPYSEVIESAKYPSNVTAVQDNVIQVTFAITKPERTKIVEICARTSDTGDWFIVKSYKRSEFFTDAFGNYRYIFQGTEQQVPIATADAIKQQEGTPLESKDMELQKNKLFLIDSLTGFDYRENDMTLTAVVQEETNVEGRRYFKEGALYNIGVRFFDSQMRTDGTVHKVTQVNVPNNGGNGFESLPSEVGRKPSRRQYLSVTLQGKPPEWARYYVVVRSDQLTYSDWVQFHTWIHYYTRPQVDADNPSSDADHYYMFGNRYIKNSAVTSIDDWRYLHLQVPTNIPFAPQRGMVVNYVSSTQVGVPEQMTVLDVVGNLLILDKPVNVVNGKFSRETVFIEVYIPKQVAETNSFYECTDVMEITDHGTENRAFGTSPVSVYADVLLVENEDEELNWKYDWNDYTTSGSTDDEKGLREDKFTYGWFETYSPSFQPTQSIDIKTGETEGIQRLFTLPENYEYEFSYDFGYINDQSFATKNLGRPVPLLQNVRQERRESVIRWSNDYVANAQINGIHTFEPLNEYPLPLERGPVVKLQNAGQDVMLAIHSSAVTSMYIGKGIIRSADLDPTLVTTDSVIGTDNQLKYSFGTVHPESVCEVDGNVYFWDGTRNEPVRYGQNGLTPMATTFATRVFFKDTIPATFGNSSEYTCNTEYDRLLNMVFFTFSNGSTSLTIGFHETSKSWIGKYGFTPEIYGVVGDKFIGFVEGVPWLHNQTDQHNTFYGTAYPATATFVLNIGGHREKAWDGIMLDSNKVWDVPEISNSEGQFSSLLAEDFVWRDQVYYADFLRDINTDPQLLSVGQIALRHGNFLSSQTLTLKLELDSSEAFYLHSVAVASTLKAGHMVQQ